MQFLQLVENDEKFDGSEERVNSSARWCIFEKNNIFQLVIFPAGGLCAGPTERTDIMANEGVSSGSLRYIRNLRPVAHDERFVSDHARFVGIGNGPVRRCNIDPRSAPAIVVVRGGFPLKGLREAAARENECMAVMGTDAPAAHSPPLVVVSPVAL